jgi:hypothetical protein
MKAPEAYVIMIRLHDVIHEIQTPETDPGRFTLFATR